MAFLMRSDQQTLLVAANPFGSSPHQAIILPTTVLTPGDRTGRKWEVHFRHGTVDLQCKDEVLTVELTPGSACIIEL